MKKMITTVAAGVVTLCLVACSPMTGLGPAGPAQPTDEEIIQAYGKLLDAVNDPQPEQASKAEEVICRTSHRLADGRPSWHRDFTGEVPQRGHRELIQLLPVATVDPYKRSVLERWEHGSEVGLEVMTFTAVVGPREGGRSLAPCFYGVDTGPRAPFGNDIGRLGTDPK